MKMNGDFWRGTFRRFAYKWYVSWMRARANEVKLQEMQANAVRIITPDANARNGTAFDGVTFRNLDDRAVFTMIQNVAVDPIMQRLDRMERLLIAAGGKPKAAGLLPEETGIQLPPIPQYVTLAGLCRKYNFQPSYHNILLGETVNPTTGQYELVSGDMGDFVHGIVTGMTGFGKSWQLRAMAKQLATSDDCDLAFVDYGVNTFGRLAHHGMYKIADTQEMAVALFRALLHEMNNRREKMAQYPEVEKLSDYNQVTGESMRPVVVFCDEAAVLFDKSGDLRGLARDVTGAGRKFGIGAVFGGTDFKVGTMPSETRGNCGLRLAMHIEEPQLSRSIIHSTAATNLEGKGRALARLPGVKGLFEIQCPAIENWDDLPGEREQIAIKPKQQTEREHVLEMHGQGMSKRQIAKSVYGYTGGAAHSKVSEILGGTTVLDV